MPEYKYRVSDKKGNVYTNTIQARNKNEAILILKRNGYQALEVIEQKANLKYEIQGTANTPNKVGAKAGTKNKNINAKEEGTLSSMASKDITIGMPEKKVQTRDLVIFLQDLLVLKEANFNNIDAIRLIIKATESKTLKRILEEMLQAMEGGEFMYVEMQKHEKIFPFIVTNMIKVGEMTGSLTDAVRESIVYIEKSDKIRKRVRKILIPNITMFFGLIIMLVVATLIAVPKIKEVFASVGTKAELPWITLKFNDFLGVAMQYWYIPVIVISLIVVSIWMYVITPQGRYQVHMVKYKMPIFGSLIYLLDYTKLIRALLINIKTGIKIQEALEISRNVVGNEIMKTLIDQAINKIYNGESWLEPFESAGLGSPMTTEMLKIGMETDIKSMMEKLLELMENDINDKLEKILKILPEITYAVVGSVLIFFVVVVLVPVMQVYMGTFLFSTI